MTHLIFAESSWFVTSAMFDIHYEIPSLIVVAAASLLPDADYPKSYTGRMLGSLSHELNRFFGHRTFLHSWLAWFLVTLTLGAPLWWFFERPAPAVAVLVGYGSHILADMMTVGGVLFFWPSRAIAVFPGRDEYRVVSGGTSERVFVGFAIAFALLFYPVSRVGFDGLIYRMGGADTPYATIAEVTDGDTLIVDTQGQTTPIRLIGVDTPETVAPDEPVGCFGPEASDYSKKTLTPGRVVRLEVPRIGDSEDAYGRTLAYVYTDDDGDGTYDHPFNEDLLRLGLARPTTFAHTYSRRYENIADAARDEDVGLWAKCPEDVGP